MRHPCPPSVNLVEMHSTTNSISNDNRRWTIEDIGTNAISGVTNNPKSTTYNMALKTDDGLKVQFPRIQIETFANYLSAVEPEDLILAKQRKMQNIRQVELERRVSSPYSQHNSTENLLLQGIPTPFLDDSFDLKVKSCFQKVIGSNLESPIFQEKLSQYLDKVETRLIGEISTRSFNFFEALDGFKELEACISDTSKRVVQLRESIVTSSFDFSKKGLAVVKLADKKARLQELRDVLSTIMLLQERIPLLESLLQVSDIVAVSQVLEDSRKSVPETYRNCTPIKLLLSKIEMFDKTVKDQLESDFFEIVREVLGTRDDNIQSPTEEVRQRLILTISPFKDSFLLFGDFEKQIKSISSSFWHDFVKESFPNNSKRQEMKEFMESLRLLTNLMVRYLKNLKLLFTEMESLQIKDLSTVCSLVEQDIFEMFHVNFASIIHQRKEQNCQLSMPHFFELYDLAVRFSSDAEDISGFKVSDVMETILEQSQAYLAQFLERKTLQLTMMIENETWSTVDCGVVQGILDRWTTERAAVESKMNDFVLFDMRKYFLVGTIVILVSSFESLETFFTHIPSSKREIATSMVKMILLFNEKSAKMILGAGALKSAGLRNITAKHISLLAQSLSFLQHFLDFLFTKFDFKSLSLGTLETSVQDLNSHESRLYRKLVSIMTERVNRHCRDMLIVDWSIAQLPSNPSKLLLKETKTLYKVVTQYLPENVVKSLFLNIAALYGERLGFAFTTLSQEVDFNCEDRLVNEKQFLVTKFEKSCGITVKIE